MTTLLPSPTFNFWTIIEQFSTPGYEINLTKAEGKPQLTVEIFVKRPRKYLGIRFGTKTLPHRTYHLDITAGNPFHELSSPDLQAPGPDTQLNWADYRDYAQKGFEENPMSDRRLDLLNAASGLAEEASEVMSLVRKHVFHSRSLDKAKFLSECGDLTWFFANILRLLDVNLGDVLIGNRVKLDERYPNGRAKNFELNPHRDEERENELIVARTMTGDTDSRYVHATPEPAKD